VFIFVFFLDTVDVLEYLHVYLLIHRTPPELSPLSLHDALPISERRPTLSSALPAAVHGLSRLCLSNDGGGLTARYQPWGHACGRSEEHTSELQSHLNLVCRLLLEKKQLRLDPPATVRAELLTLT